MGAAYTKVCILLCPDEASLGIIAKIVGYLTGTLVPVTKDPGMLPYHMTIIGGGRVEENEQTKIKLRSIALEIKPFQSKDFLPTVERVEPIPLFGGNIAIRLKFESGTYLITGNIQKNKALKAFLSSNHHFDFIRHITLYRVGNDYDLMDEKLALLEHLLGAYKEELLAMTFTPEIWVKPSTSNEWNKLDLALTS